MSSGALPPLYPLVGRPLRTSLLPRPRGSQHPHRSPLLMGRPRAGTASPPHCHQARALVPPFCCKKHGRSNCRIQTPRSFSQASFDFDAHLYRSLKQTPKWASWACSPLSSAPLPSAPSSPSPLTFLLRSFLACTAVGLSSLAPGGRGGGGLGVGDVWLGLAPPWPFRRARERC